jgi:hypothetical protein
MIDCVERFHRQKPTGNAATTLPDSDSCRHSEKAMVGDTPMALEAGATLTWSL